MTLTYYIIDIDSNNGCKSLPDKQWKDTILADIIQYNSMIFSGYSTSLNTIKGYIHYLNMTFDNVMNFVNYKIHACTLESDTESRDIQLICSQYDLNYRHMNTNNYIDRLDSTTIDFSVYATIALLSDDIFLPFDYVDIIDLYISHIIPVLQFVLPKNVEHLLIMIRLMYDPNGLYLKNKTSCRITATEDFRIEVLDEAMMYHMYIAHFLYSKLDDEVLPFY